MPLSLFSRGAFEPSHDIPSLSGKVILVTGGNTGLGKQSILDLAKHDPDQIWLTARNLAKANEAVDDIKAQVPGARIKILQLDLTSFKSVQNAVKAFLAEASRLDILMLNAGIMAYPPGTTEDGYEIQFGTNHMGHALLVKLLLPLLQKTALESENADVRIVSISSTGHNFAPKEGIQFENLKTTGENIGPVARYGQSKLANILFSKQLAKRFPRLTVVSLHPGTVSTQLGDAMASNGILLPIAMYVTQYLIGVRIEEGVKTQLWASTAEGVVSGTYYEPIGLIGKGSKLSNDSDLAERLWKWTEEELKEYGTWDVQA